LAVLAGLLLPPTAQADCAEPPESGRWVNASQATTGVTAIELTFVCQDVIIGGTPYPPGPPWKGSVLWSCQPQPCDWGQVAARTLPDHLYLAFDQGQVKRHVFARMSRYRPGQLWVYTRSVDNNPSTPDLETQDWFVR
jgi:hypothetical protein